MASRSDQLQSHQFVLRRAIAAVALRDPDHGSSPLRRSGGALFAGLMVAVLGVAAAGVYGLLRPTGGNEWRDGSAVIIEKETGARFVLRDGVLHPVLNYSSALLILGSPQPASAHVPRSALVGVARGTPLGIPGAPDLLPGVGDLVSTPWVLCSRPSSPTAAVSAPPPESVLFVGAPTTTGAALVERALLASDAEGGLHLLWHSRRYLITHPDLVLAAFGWSRQAAVPVATATLNAVPVGQDLGRLTVERSDKSSPVAGYRIGEVFVVQNSSGGRQFGLAMSDGLADITQVQADLLVADGANGLGGKPREMGQALFASARRAAPLVPSGPLAPPPTTPELAQPTGGVCAAFADGVATPELSAGEAPRGSAEIRTSPATAPGSVPVGPVVDWVAVAPGRGAVVEALAGPGATGGALALVSDLGLRFPLASRDILALLGYAQVHAQRLPAGLVGLVPAGRALDPAAALLPATG